MLSVLTAIVVGVDGSPVSMRALDLAAGEAALRDAPLRIVHVLESIDGRRPGHLAKAMAVSPRRVLSLAYQAAEQRHPELSIDTVTLDGSPAEALIAASAAARLTVVGHRGGGGFLGLTAGAVCSEVAARGHGPILVTRGATPLRRMAPIILGVDAAAPVRAAIEFAFTEAALRGVLLRAVYAFTHESAAGPFAPPRYDLGETRRQAERQLAEVLAGWAEKYPDVKVDLLVKHNLDPPDAMLSASSEASLVVVGPHARMPRQRHPGSVAGILVHHARCPVAVVHPLAG
jgi:nucleotide-binding universal stress UspA family protein